MYSKVPKMAFLADMGKSGIICVWINYEKIHSSC